MFCATVFMGMGEPLLNLRNVLPALEFLIGNMGIGARHITVSSVGVPNSIMMLAARRLQATLAISLHAPNQQLREQIVPRYKSSQGLCEWVIKFSQLLTLCCPGLQRKGLPSKCAAAGLPGVLPPHWPKDYL